ncbi:MAG: hypothetical protein WC644_13325 [Ignavibacteria bacterium]
MAKVIKQFLGVTRGKIGDNVFKRREGSSYVASAPVQYKKTKSKDLIKNRKRFAAISKFASAVTDSPYRYRIWKKPNLKGKTPYKKCFTYNYAYTKGSKSWHFTSITPGKLGLIDKNVILTPDTVEINFRISEEIFNILKDDFIASTVIFMREPNKNELRELRYNSYITIEKEVRGYVPSLTEINHFKHEFDKPGLLAITEKYKNVMVYTAFISTKEVKGKLKYTAGEANVIRGFEAERGESAEKITPQKVDDEQVQPYYRFRVR